MKKIIILLLFVFHLTTSCRKENLETNVIPEETTNDQIKVKDGHLEFKDYDQFLATFQTLAAASPTEQIKWEKSLGFESLNTIFNRFNQELKELETLDKKTFLLEFEALKEKYKQQIIFEDSAYFLNCSGKFESLLTNKDGIVKIGSDFIRCRRNSIETFKNDTYTSVLRKTSSTKEPNNILRQKGNNSISAIHPGSLPSTNSFSMYTGPLIFQENGRGKFYGKLKMYNIHTSSAGYRGFITLEVFAQHKNILGHYRDVPSMTSTSCLSNTQGLELTKLNTDGSVNSTSRFPIKVGKMGPVIIGQPIPIEWNSTPNMSERYELVLMCSKHLKDNSTILTGVGNGTVFGSLVNTVDDDFLQPYGFWSSFGATQYDLGPGQLQIKAFSQGDGLFPSSINYDMYVNFADY